MMHMSVHVAKDSISKDRREMTECGCTKQSLEENEKAMA